MRTFIISLFFLASALSSVAQPSPRYDRQRYIDEIRTYKHEYLVRELQIPDDKQQQFFEAYDAMEDELMQLNADTRRMERQINENADATDVEIEAALLIIYNEKVRAGEIELRYLEKLRESLTSQQIIKLREAERKFNRQMMKHHRRHHRDTPTTPPLPEQNR